MDGEDSMGTQVYVDMQTYTCKEYFITKPIDLKPYHQHICGTCICRLYLNRMHCFFVVMSSDRLRLWQLPQTPQTTRLRARQTCMICMSACFPFFPARTWAIDECVHTPIQMGWKQTIFMNTIYLHAIHSQLN